jgi:hypothetical protein
MAVYLDTNAYDHLYKKIGCTSADIANLRKKIYGRELSIPLSIHTLEEILLDRRARPELLVAKIKLTLSLGNFRRMVKPCNQLLTDDIRSYAKTGEATRAFLDANVQNVISEGIAELIETDGEELDDGMIAALEEARRRKEHFRTQMIVGWENIRQDARQMTEPNFAEYFETGAEMVAERYVERLGLLSECRERGIDGLLRIKSVRMMVGVSLSYFYWLTFEATSPGRGDSVDMLHAVSAAAVADTFVTDDAALRRTVARVPLDNFEVLDLPTFLQRAG